MPKCPKIRVPSGADVAIVEVTGDPRNQEPTHVRIQFPGGELELVRAKDGKDADYWCHVRLNRPGDAEVLECDAEAATVTDGRIDVRGKHASESAAGDLNHPDLYHLAVRVTRVGIIHRPGGVK
jgi:hypothetical protein